MPRRKQGQEEISGGEIKRRAGPIEVASSDEAKLSITNEKVSKIEKVSTTKTPKPLQNGKFTFESMHIKKSLNISKKNSSCNGSKNQNQELQSKNAQQNNKPAVLDSSELDARSEFLQLEQQNAQGNKSQLDSPNIQKSSITHTSDTSSHKHSSRPVIFETEQNKIDVKIASNGEKLHDDIETTLSKVSTAVAETMSSMCNEVETDRTRSADNRLEPTTATNQNSVENQTNAFLSSNNVAQKVQNNKKVQADDTETSNDNYETLKWKSNGEGMKLTKLKLPEPLFSSDDSNSLQLLPESSRNKNFPKVTSPQILEQHISKIISENAAIVETLDPLWSRRYLRQTSQTQEGESKKSTATNKGRRPSDEKAPQSLADRNSSKLQSALLGTLDQEKPSMSEFREHCRKQSCPVSSPETVAEELKTEKSIGTSNYNLPRQSKMKSQSVNNEKREQHPQNPEGSIIKDLLLKSKSKTKPMSGVDVEAVTLNKCRYCSLKYVDKNMLEIHESICKNRTAATSSQSNLHESKTSFLSENVFKIGSADKLMPNLPLLNPQALSSSIEDLLKNDTSAACSTVSSSMGHILKKQLLSPLSNRKCSTAKRRKFSEPVMLTSNDSTLENRLSESLLQESASNGSSLEDRLFSPPRSRSQSIHLFGGEVEILDGEKTKKLKIMSSLSEAISLPSTTQQSSNSSKLLPSSDSNSPYQTVVSISQHAHSSGGTVTHVSSPKESKSLSPIVLGTLPSQFPQFNSNQIDSRRSVSPSTSSKGQLSTATEVITFAHRTKRSASKSPTPPSSGESNSNSPTPFNLMKQSNTTSVISSFRSAFAKLGKSEELKTDRISEKVQNYFPNIKFRSSSPMATKSSSDSSKHLVPNMSFTPSSPIDLTCTEIDKQNSEDQEPEEKECLSKSFLAPTRPTSLPLKKKPFTMVGSTLVSPDTPRPKKNCVQLYLNGHAYTYLGLKCSTRSTYCSIYRPQPMFVTQDTDPTLSMYSNWQVVPAKEELGGVTPGQSLGFYNTKKIHQQSDTVFTTAKQGEPLSVTHSSYWTYRAMKRDRKLNAKHPGPVFDEMELPTNSSYLREDSQLCLGEPTLSSLLLEPHNINENPIKTERTSTSSISENTSSLDVEASLSDFEENTSNIDDEEDDERTDLTDSSQSKPPKRVKIFEGGFKSNEDYTYVRGRGRGKYVCEECGIRCKKPSMLKKHIRTHTDLRPYKCRHCSFAFKTKGNLTKHMKSKAHHKKCTELGIVPVPTTSDDSQIDEETLSKQEQYQKKNFGFSEDIDDDDDDDDHEDQDDDCDDSEGVEEDDDSDNSLPTKTSPNKFLASEAMETNLHGELGSVLKDKIENETSIQGAMEQEAAHSLLHLSSLNDSPEHWTATSSDVNYSTTPSEVVEKMPLDSQSLSDSLPSCPIPSSSDATAEIPTFEETQKTYDPTAAYILVPDDTLGYRPRSYSAGVSFTKQPLHKPNTQGTFSDSIEEDMTDVEFAGRELGTRRYSISVAREARRPPRLSQSPRWGHPHSELTRWPEMDGLEQPMDLRMPRLGNIGRDRLFHGSSDSLLSVGAPMEDSVQALNSEVYLNEPFAIKGMSVLQPQLYTDYESSLDSGAKNFNSLSQEKTNLTGQSPVFYATKSTPETTVMRSEVDSVESQQSPEIPEYALCSPVSPSSIEDSFYNQEPMPGLPEEQQQSTPGPQAKFIKPSTSTSMDEGKCVCRICNKIFAKAGQLRIHVNIHYFERPFRCDNCGVSFRTKGHLQKHKRSVSHYNKVNMNMTFGTPSVDNPRPFKCGDCKIAFRIHGHLAKHLRSKMHIMKLECLGKLPFGMYAEMERSGISLNEIDTTDCNNSLESLQVMAQKLYQQDPRRMRWHSPNHVPAELESSKCPSSLPSDVLHSVPDPLSSSLSAITVPVPSTVSSNPSSEGEVKKEPSDPLSNQNVPQITTNEGEISSTASLPTNQNVLNQKNAAQKEGESSVALHRSDTCHLCGRMFKSAKFLQVHLYCDHSSWSVPSGDTTSTSATSTTSPRTSVIQQDLVCDLCSKHFPNQNSLQQHLLTHSQPRPFVCDVCDAGFTSSASLVTHLATHQTTNAEPKDASLLQLQ